jgi:hypothetical protein
VAERQQPAQGRYGVPCVGGPARLALIKIPCLDCLPGQVRRLLAASPCKRRLDAVEIIPLGARLHPGEEGIISLE